jgi:hypothetical protein
MKGNSPADPQTLAKRVVAHELDRAFTSALRRLEIAGISDEVAWSAIHEAINAVQRCFVEGDQVLLPPQAVEAAQV